MASAADAECRDKVQVIKEVDGAIAVEIGSRVTGAESRDEVQIVKEVDRAIAVEIRSAHRRNKGRPVSTAHSEGTDREFLGACFGLTNGKGQFHISQTTDLTAASGDHKRRKFGCGEGVRAHQDHASTQ